MRLFLLHTVCTALYNSISFAKLFLGFRIRAHEVSALFCLSVVVFKLLLRLRLLKIGPRILYHTSYLSPMSPIYRWRKNRSCGEISRFFKYMTDVEKFEISPHVEEFQIFHTPDVEKGHNFMKLVHHFFKGLLP